MGNGLTKSFPFNFKVQQPSDLHIFITDPSVGQAVEVYNWTATPSEGKYPTVGGTITYPTSGQALPEGWKLTIARIVALKQDIEFANNSSLKPKEIENSLDRIVMMAQQIEEVAERALRMDISNTDDSDSYLATVQSVAAYADTSANRALTAAANAEAAAEDLAAAVNAAEAAAAIATNATLLPKFLSGAVAPTADIGKDGDIYMQTNGDVFVKNGGWGLLLNIKGGKGDKGDKGESITGAPGPKGDSGIADIRNGVITVNMDAYNSGDGFYYSQWTAINVTFSPAFTTIPKVSATAYIADGGGSGGTVGVWVSSVSTTGMMIVASSKYNTTADIYWTATVASIGGGGGTTIGASYANIYDFGEVDNTGETDITSIMQTAHNTGRIIFYPRGVYQFNNITLPNGGGIIGEGTGATHLWRNGSTGHAVSYSPSLSSTEFGGPMFHNFKLSSQDPSSGAHINIAPTGAEVWGTSIFNVMLMHTYNGFVFNNAAHWKMTDCTVFNWYGSAIDVANTLVVDSGDSVIKGGLFSNGRTSGSGIIHRSSGGLKVIGNKFLGGQYGYLMDITAGAQTSILLFEGNSIENQSVANMAFNVGSGGYYGFVTLIGNELALCPKGISVNGIGSRLQHIIANGNHINSSNIAIEMAGGDNTMMSGNIIYGANYAMSIGSGCTNGTAYVNRITGAISNSSGSFSIS